MERHSNAIWWVGFIGTVLILGTFAISSLLLTNVGIQVYHNIVKANNDNFELRTSLNYVATRIRQKDAAESITMTEKDGIPVLSLSYTGGTGYRYEVLIYHYNGSLREHMRLEGDPFELGYGFEMVEIEDFRIQLNGNSLKLTATNHTGESESLTMSLRTLQ